MLVAPVAPIHDRNIPVKILIVVVAALWSASVFGVVRCEANGKVEYRNPPCPLGTEQTTDSTRVGTSVQRAAPTPPVIRPAPAEALKTDVEREDENARFLQQERRLREERLKREAEEANRDAASKPADVVQDATPPAVVPEANKQPSVEPATPAGATSKVLPGKADKTSVSARSRDSPSKFGGAYLYLLPLAMVIVLAIVQTRRGNGSALRWTLAAIFGLLAGFLIYFIVAMLSMRRAGPGPLFVLLTLSAGWVVSTYVLGNRAESWLRVLQRAFLLGAAQWLLVIPASWVWTGRAVVSTVEHIGPTATGAVGAILGGGLIALLTGGVALLMLVLCAIGYLIVFFVQRGRTPVPSMSSQ